MRLTELLPQLASFFAARNIDAWLVGGAARDLALGLAPTDLDIAVAADGVVLARELADHWGAAFVPLDIERATGRVVTRDQRHTIDLVGLRGPDIETDLRLRDVSVNALALPLHSAAQTDNFSSAQWIDPTGGVLDLRNHTLRLCSPNSLHDDPLRIVRLARIGAQLGLKPIPGLDAAVREARAGLDHVANERIRDELLKLLDLPTAAHWISVLDEWRVLTQIIPELEAARHCEQPRVHFLPVLAHTLEAVAALEWLIDGGAWAETPGTKRIPVALQHYPALPRELPFAAQYAAQWEEARAGGHRRAALLKLAALLHDNAKPQTKNVLPEGKVTFYGHQDIGAEIAAKICRRLRLSRQDSEYVAGVVREHMRPGQLRSAETLTNRARARFFRELKDLGPDVLLHELADHMATRGPHILPQHWAAHLDWMQVMLDGYWGLPPERHEPLLRGNDLINELGIAPGPQIGRLLSEIAVARAAGEISTRAEALELVRQLKNHN